MVEDVYPLPRAGQNHPFPLLPPCPTWKVAKAFPVVRLETIFLCCCWSWTSCHNPCRQMHGCQVMCCLGVPKDWKVLSHTLQRWTLSLLCDLSPILISSKNNMNFLTNPPLTSSGSGTRRWAPLFMCLLKLEPIQQSWSFCMPTTWPGICLAVFLRVGWLHGPPTCV